MGKAELTLPQKSGQRLGDTAGQRQDRLAPEAPVGFGIVGEGVVARDAQKHRWNTEGKCNLAGGGILRLDELHILGAEAHFLPVEAALQHHGAPGIGSTLIALLQFALQPFELLRGQMTVGCRIDQRARRPRAVVKHRLVPGGGGIVRVDRALRGLERRHAVVVVQRIEKLQVQDVVSRQPHRLSVDRVFKCLGPAVRGGDGLHAVRAQRVDLADAAIDVDLLDIGIAGHQQKAEELFEELAAGLARIGLGQECEQRMQCRFRFAIVDEPGQRGGGFRDHADGAVADCIGGEALLRQCRIVARRPLGPARRMHRNQRRRRRSLLLGREESPKTVQHEVSPILPFKSSSRAVRDRGGA
jgi:hypothetical protein